MAHLASKLDFVLHLAAKGFNVFPVTENQKMPPLIKGWQSSATRDEKQLRDTWEFAPNLNIGCLLPGGFSLDFDVKKGGLESMKRMEEAGLLPRTHTQRSPTGGVHKTYRCSPKIAEALKNAVGDIPGFPGVDIRTARKGYIVGAGSTTEDGAYTIEDDAPFADAPPILLALLPVIDDRPERKFDPPAETQDSQAEVARAIDYLLNQAEEAVQGGGGDNATIRVINRVRDFNLSAGKTLELLCDYWNETKAIPPWDLDELAKKVESASKSRRSAVGIKAPENEFDAIESADLRANKTAPLPGTWDEPTDLWRDEAPPADVLEGIAPSIAVRFGRDRALSFGVNSDAVVATTVAVLGSLIPATNVLQMYNNRSSWQVIPTFWTALVGDPGSAKTAAVKAPLVFAKAIDKKWSTEFTNEMKEYERAEIAYSARAPKKKSDAAGPTDGLPDREFETAPVPPQKPKFRSKIANDATSEALATRLAETPEVAPIILHADEVAGWIGSLDAYRTKGTKDRGFFLQAKDGGSYRVDRQGRGSILVPNLAISVIGGIQDDMLAKLAPDLETDGLLQRFAVVALRQLGLGDDTPEDPALEAMIPRVGLALSSLGEATYHFGPDAAAELNQIKSFKAREMGRTDMPSGLKTWLAKADSEFGRYALAFHLVEWAVIADALETGPDAVISHATARRARRYIEEFLYPHAQYIHATVLGGGWSDNETRWVAAYILTRRLEKITAREIGKNYRRLGKNRKWLFAVMSRLELEGWVRLINADPGQWKVNPAVHDGRFDQIRQSEGERRAAVRGKIAADAEARRADAGRA